MTNNERLQAMMQLYKEETGERVLDLDAVAAWAIKRGATLPKPKTAQELFAAQLADAARAEHRTDPKTGLSYRANHALRHRTPDGRQMVLWIDMEDATRPQMLYSLSDRRQQMVGDAVHLKIDEMIWNGKNPDEEQIALDMDFTYDVEERLHSPSYGTGEAA